VRSSRVVVRLMVVVTALWGVQAASAHTRERERLDALELSIRQQSAAVAQQVSTLEEKQGRLDQGLEERRIHGERLQQRMRTIEDNVEQGLRAIRDTLGKDVDGKLAELARRADLADEQRRAMQESLSAFEATLKAFRTSLTDYATAVDGRVAALQKRLDAIEAEGKRVDGQLLARIDGLVKVVDDENSKLRKAITSAVRAPGEPSVHVVQPGENLWGIAKKYSLSTTALLGANPGLKSDDAVIHPGDKIAIPAP